MPVATCTRCAVKVAFAHMKWESAALSDVGRRRAGNEDSYLMRPALGIFAVADGMGGHAAGEVASRIAVETVEAHVDTAYSRLHGRVRATGIMRDAVQAANQEILDRAGRDPTLQGMGTTLTAMALVSRDGCGVVAHVGDSRAYRLRDGELLQVTRDQTWVQQQVDDGVLTPESARVHPFSNILSQALGTDPDVEVEIEEVDVREGDRFLLCSDGLTGMLPDRVIRRILVDAPDVHDAVRRLIEEGNERGGHDNITAVLVHVTG